MGDSDEGAGQAPAPDHALAKQLQVEKEKNDLITSIAQGDFSTLKAKVAAMLNLFPMTRNSDVSLALKYWEVFQPEIYKPTGILPRDLFKLERLHYIVRARAKIQNEYGLFLADAKIRGHRKGREEEMDEAVIEDAPPRKVVLIYADETGKTQNFAIVASVWVLNGYAVYAIGRAIERWKSASIWSDREVHFSRFGKADFVTLEEYLGVVTGQREFLSFKAIAVKRNLVKRSIEDTVLKLHEHMMLKGVDHEVSTGRIDLPRDFELTVDAEDSLDAIHLEEMKIRVNQRLSVGYSEKTILSAARSASSKSSHMLQLADLVAGATNRRLNHNGDRNHKDDMADLIIERLGLRLNDEAVPELDATALFTL